MRRVAYYVVFSVWVGGLSSPRGVGFVMGWCDVFHGGFGGFGLTGVGLVCIIKGVRLRDKESSQAGIAW